jgi:hypothetical protein
MLAPSHKAMPWTRKMSSRSKRRMHFAVNRLPELITVDENSSWTKVDSYIDGDQVEFINW